MTHRTSKWAAIHHLSFGPYRPEVMVREIAQEIMSFIGLALHERGRSIESIFDEAKDRAAHHHCLLNVTAIIPGDYAIFTVVRQTTYPTYGIIHCKTALSPIP